MASKHQILCWQCNAPLTEARALHEKNLVRDADKAVIAAQREFKGLCPNHGLANGRHVNAEGDSGHHSTYSAAQMKRRFPKRRWDRIREGLNEADRRRFDYALCGRYLPNVEDLERWDRLAVDGTS